MALESEIEEDDNIFPVMRINLIVDGIPPELIEKIFQHSLLTSTYSGSDLLDRLLISEGIMSIQKGFGSVIIAHILGAMIEEKYIPEMVAIAKQTTDLKKFFDSNFLLESSLESFEFEKKLLRLTRIELSRVLLPTSVS